MNRTEHSTGTVGAPALCDIMINDEVTNIAIALGEAERTREMYEGRAATDDFVQSRTYDHYQNEASDRVYVLKDMLAQHQAVTLTAAAIQVAELISRFDMIIDQMPKEVTSYQVEKDSRALNRLAYSVLGLLQSRIDTPVEDIVYPHFTNKHCNPWISVEENFAIRGIGEGERS